MKKSEQKQEVNMQFTKQVSPTEFHAYLVWCGHNWGRGKSLQDAINAANVHPANKFEATLFISKSPIEVWVRDSGGWSFNCEGEVEDVSTVDLGEICLDYREDKVHGLYEQLISTVREEKGRTAAYDNFEASLEEKLFNLGYEF